MTRLALLVLLAVSFAAAQAQSAKKVSASYTYYAPETMSVDEAKRIALDRARIQAVEEAFGSIVGQSTSTLISTTNGQTDTRFFSHGGSNLKGEWIETIGQPEYDVAYADGMLVVGVKVSGRIREFGKNRVPLKVQVLRNGFEARNEDDSFRSGDDLYLAFQSPVAGQVLVYLVDYATSTVYCLLPYSGSNTPARLVDADAHYVFFSEKHAQPFEKSLVDEYTLTLADPTQPEHNEIVVLFATEGLVKENSEQADAGLPRQLSLDDFERWRAKLQMKSSDIQVIHKPITIK